MHQAELPEEQINPTQLTDCRPDSKLVPESPTEWTNIGDDSSVCFRVSLNDMVFF